MLAIFMAIFLFFLSVALVSQNRLDITLALSADHRLGADLAAHAGTQYALARMRSESNWEADLAGGVEDETSHGAEWRVVVNPYPDPSGSPYLFEIHSAGSDGVVTRHQRMLVEEARLRTPDRQDQLKPHLFGVIDTGASAKSLAVLGPGFKWQNLGEMPRAEPVITANGGPLFAFGEPGTGQKPPAILDNIPLYPEGAAAGDPAEAGPLIRVELVPPGEHLLVLKMDGDTVQWEDIPDPGPALGRWNGLIEDDGSFGELPVWKVYPQTEAERTRDETDPWEKRTLRLRGQQNEETNVWEILAAETQMVRWGDSLQDFTVNTTTEPFGESFWDQAQTTTELTLEWETLTQPAVFLEWYSLDGKAPVARGNEVFCLATHYFYGHIKQEGEFVEFGSSTFDSIVYREPCVLKYSLASETWTIVNDMMRVDQPDTEPHIYTGPKPHKAVLVAHPEENEVLAYNRERPTEVLRARETAWTPSFSSISHLDPLVAYRDGIYHYRTRQSQLSSQPRKVLSLANGAVLDVGSQIRIDQREVSAEVPSPEGGFVPTTLLPELQVEFGLLGDRNSTAWGKDLIAVASATQRVSQPSYDLFGTLTPEYQRQGQISTLVRFNGEHWQVLPTGLTGLLRHHTSRPGTPGLRIRVADQETFLDTNYGIALAGYASEEEEVGRYSLVKTTFER